MAAMTSQRVTTSTVRWTFGCLPKWEMTEPSGLDPFASWTCIVSTANGLRIMSWASRFQVCALVWQDAAAAPHVEPGVFPSPQHLGAGGRQQALFG
jgi:hypothetical protein